MSQKEVKMQEVSVDRGERDRMKATEMKQPGVHRVRLRIKSSVAANENA